MVTIVAINMIDPHHLADVRAEMAERGAPIVRCVRDDSQGLIVAIEGSHRLAAAAELDLVPILKILEPSEMLLCDEIGFDDCGWFGGEPASAGAIRDRMAGPSGDYAGCPFLRFPHVGFE